MTSSTRIFADLADICGEVEIAVRGHRGTADRRRRRPPSRSSARRRDRPPRASGSRTPRFALLVPAAARRRRPADRSSRRCGWSASSSGWATSRCTSPRSPGCGCPRGRARGAAPDHRADGRGRRGHGRAGSRSIIADATSTPPSSSAATTRRWTSCAARSFTELLSDDWKHGVEAAVDIALLGPLLRADRRPRRLGRQPRRLRGHRRAPRSRRRLSGRRAMPRHAGRTVARAAAVGRPATAQRPWLATAAAAAAAASGSRYSPPATVGRRSRRVGRPAASRWGC